MKKQILTTPKGSVLYSHLHKPNTMFRKDAPYSIKLVCNPDDCTELLKEINTIYDNHKLGLINRNEKFKELDETNKGYKFLDDGNIEFNFKRSSSYVDKNTQDEIPLNPPPVFDVAGLPMQPTPVIGNGSTMIIKFTPRPYNTPIAGCGLSLRIEACQLLEFIHGDPQTAEEFGFDVVKDLGFEEF